MKGEGNVTTLGDRGGGTTYTYGTTLGKCRLYLKQEQLKRQGGYSTVWFSIGCYRGYYHYNDFFFEFIVNKFLSNSN